MDEVKTEDKEKNSTDLYLELLKVFSSTQPNVPLEKEVSYLKGKIDTLEKIIIGR